MKKFFTITFTIILICSLGFNYYQHKRLVYSYNIVADEFISQLSGTKQSLDSMQNSKDENDLSMFAYNVWNAPERLGRYGMFLDSMAQNSNSNVSALSRVGVDLLNITLDVWSKNGLKEPIRSGNNSVPSPDELVKLKEVYAIYRSHFTDSIIRHTDYKKQRQALLDAHEEIKKKGLDQLLKNPSMLDMGLQ